MKYLKKRSAIIMATIMMVIMSCPLLAFAAEEYESPVHCTFWSLLPPIIAIALALITKEVYSSLFIGICVGSALYAGGNFERFIYHLMPEGFIASLSDAYNVGILIFLAILGMIVGMMNKTGAAAAFGNWAQKKIKTRTGAQLATVGLGCLIFIDDYFNCLTVGSVMRPVTDKHNISRAKLAYLIDSTAAPVCIIAPISSWAAAVSGFVPGSDGFQVFIRAIPYNYYAILTITMMICVAVFQIDYGPMRLHEENAILHGDLYTTPDRPYANAADDSISGKGQVIDMIVPVVVLIFLCACGMLYSGGHYGGMFFTEDGARVGFVDAFSNSDASIGLSIGGIAGLLFTIIWFMAKKTLTFTDIMECIPEGFQAMVPAILILTHAWTLKAMTDSLGAAPFVAGGMENVAGSLMNFLPAVIFLVAVGLGFATGTSWGTFGILIPIVVEMFHGRDETMMIMAMSACMAGAVCGDHCSPISDTTIMSSAGAQCNHINHVNTQIPYAMTCAVVSCISYIIAGFVRSAAIALPIAVVLMVLTVIALRAKFGRDDIVPKNND